MGAPALAAGPSPNPERPKWSLSRKIFAVLGALILVFVGVYVVYGYLNGLPPAVLSVGGHGRVYLDVAFMTMYTPTIPGATDFNVTATASFAKGLQVPFAWENVRDAALPVRFIFTPSDPFVAGPANGFAYAAGGPGRGSISAIGPHPPGACVTLWSMNYSVRELSSWEGFTQANWLEVDYSLTPLSLAFCPPLPIANVSAPTPSDLLPTGIVDNLNLSVQPGYLFPLNHDIYNATTPWPTFHHALPPVTFDAGSQGNFTASLASSFQWSKGDNYRVTMTFSGTFHGYLTWYWDERFGSLYTIFSS